MIKSASKPTPASTLPDLPTTDAWARAWQGWWSKVGLPGYELPVGGPGGDEREFLAQARTPEKERARLQRINHEFIRGFKELFDVGPAVTVFGSARFKEKHRYYRLARATGAELAKAGFATLTGGGPGIMEAANRGAHEAGGASYGLNIVLPHEQKENPYVDKSIEYQYFFTRKVCLVKYSCAFIAMPGGLGTSRRTIRSGDFDTVPEDRSVPTHPDGCRILAGPAGVVSVYGETGRICQARNRLWLCDRFTKDCGGTHFARPATCRAKATQFGWTVRLRATEPIQGHA